MLLFLNFENMFIKFIPKNYIIELFKKVVFICFVFSLLSLKLTAKSDDISALRDSVNSCYYSFDVKRINNILVQTENFISNNPDNYYGYYYNGILRYCLGRIVYNSDGNLAYNYFDTSLDMFEKAYEIKKNPVALAMMSAAYGKKSALAPLSAIFFGQKAKNRIYDAFNLDSNNSKILLVAATHLMHVPGFYGGDKKKSRRMLEKCLILNKKNSDNNNYELNWANDAEIYAYLAQIDILEEKFNSAKINMKKALELKPDYGFVLIDLENQISKARNDK